MSVRAWTVHWKDVGRHERLAWFQATRTSGNAPADGTEIVPAEAYDDLAARLAACEADLRDAGKNDARWAEREADYVAQLEALDGERFAAEAALRDREQALREIGEYARKGKIEVEGVTVNAPVWTCPTVAISWLTLIRDRALASFVADVSAGKTDG